MVSNNIFTARADIAKVDEDKSVAIKVLANDKDSDKLIVILTAAENKNTF